MKELEMLKALAKNRPGEHVTIHMTASGQFVVNMFTGPGPSQAPTLEEAVNDFHARLMGFKPATVLHEKAIRPSLERKALSNKVKATKD